MNSILFLFIYSILKAFLPLPSLEAVLLPLCILYPEHAFLFACLSGIGTCIGGHIGYEISYHFGRKSILKLVDEKTIEEGILEFKRMGYPFIIIGSISPFPDFLLAYIAGLVGMNKWIFMLLDGGCRFIRSMILVYFSIQLNEYFELDKYITIISILMLVYFIGKFALKRKK